MPKRSKSRRNRRLNKATLKGVGPAVAQDPDFYPSGQRRPPKPNEKVLEQRAALLGEGVGLERGTNPLDVALARGWLTERQHVTGRQLASLHRQFNTHGPRQGSGSLPHYDPGLAMKDPWSGITDDEIARIFDRVFNVLPRMVSEESAEVAGRRWKAACAAMTAAENAEVFWTCIRETFPQWIHERVAGRFNTIHEPRRDLLISALGKAADALRPAKVTQPRPEPEIPASAPPVSTAAHGPKLPETTDYINAAGELQYQAVRLKRRGVAA